MFYLPSQGKGISIPALQTHWHQDKELLNPVSPLASRSLLGLSLSKGENQHCVLPAQTCTSLQIHPEALWWLFMGHLNKHCKMSCIFPSFGQNYSCDSIRMWNSEQPQWSNTFLAKRFVWQTIPFSVHNSSFSKASYCVWVKGALCQKKQYHTPSPLHSAWTCFFNSE